MKLYLGDSVGAIVDIERAARLSPVDPFRYTYHICRAQTELFVGRYDEAVFWAERAVSEQPKFSGSYRFLAASLALAGRLDEARHAMTELIRLAPQMRLSNWGNWMAAYRRPDYSARILEALRLAGLPE